MARPKNPRIIFDPPKFKGYKPYGYYAREKEAVKLLFEEYSAVKLCDYELLTQAEAASAMKISRPTFTRLYETARRKIARAFAETRAIEVEKGNAWFDADWFHCRDCNAFFTNPSTDLESGKCPLCNSDKTETMNRS